MSKGGGHREPYEVTCRSPLRENSLEELRSGASIIAEARATAWRWTVRTGVFVIFLAAAIGWWLS